MKPKILSVTNLAERFYQHARAHPEKLCLTLENGEKISCQNVLNSVESLRSELLKAGLKREDRILMLYPLSLETLFMLIALFASGITPVLIDPRVPFKKWFPFVQRTEFAFIFSTPKFFNLRWVFWRLWNFKLLSYQVKGLGLTEIKPADSTPEHKALEILPEDFPTLISFTSGTTGTAKKIIRPLHVIASQQYLACSHLPIVTRDRHLAIFGISALQSMVEGAETLLCLDHSGANIGKKINDFSITRFSGPPGVFASLVQYLEDKSLTLPSLENALIGGAPIPRWLLAKASKVLPNCAINIVYGSTECEPIATGLASEFLGSSLDGYFVGKLIPELTMMEKNPREVMNKKIFEVVLNGPNLIKNSPEGLETGDLAFRDQNGNLWLLGRKNESVGDLPIAWIEEPLERIPEIRRVAYVAQTLFYETHKPLNEDEDSALRQKIRSHLESIKLDLKKMVCLANIPTDARHAWKIDRRALEEM